MESEDAEMAKVLAKSEEGHQSQPFTGGTQPQTCKFWK